MAKRLNFKPLIQQVICFGITLQVFSAAGAGETITPMIAQWDTTPASINAPVSPDRPVAVQDPTNLLFDKDEPDRVYIAMYDNLTGAGEDYYAGQNGAEAIDDIHGVYSDAPVAVSFAYFDPDSANQTPFHATVSLYENPGGHDLDMSPIDRFKTPNLRRGRQLYILRLPSGQLTGPADLWVGIQFTSPSAGLVINGGPDTPTIGSSHDYYIEDGRFFYFGGNPRANFALALYVQTVDIPDVNSLPLYTLRPNRPNPFQSRTQIGFDLSVAAPVQLGLYDLSGRLVRTILDGMWPEGRHVVTLNAREAGRTPLPPGVYFLRMRADAFTYLRRLVVVE